MERRHFLKATVGAGLAASLGPSGLLAQEGGPLPKRPLGKTGLEVSILALGGYHFAEHWGPDKPRTEEEAVALVHRAIDLGINFLDNAWSYHQGRSEEWMGKALKGGLREKVLVMTKSEQRLKEGAAKQIDESLRRLGVGRIDLWQFHGVKSVADVERIWGKGGAMEAAQEAKKAGKVRHIGLTGHADPACHLRALEFGGVETLQMPLNPADLHYLSFQKEVLPRAREKGVGVIAMKTLAMGNALRSGAYTVQEALRYVWSLEADTVVSGMTSIGQLEENAKLAKGFSPMAEAERAALAARVKPHAGTDLEWYKRKA
jgi:aryl-alcohol dehydrogenase-like predicted oxidoreductase